jgi:hypothetical protein
LRMIGRSSFSRPFCHHAIFRAMSSRHSSQKGLRLQHLTGVPKFWDPVTTRTGTLGAVTAHIRTCLVTLQWMIVATCSVRVSRLKTRFRRDRIKAIQAGRICRLNMFCEIGYLHRLRPNWSALFTISATAFAVFTEQSEEEMSMYMMKSVS